MERISAVSPRDRYCQAAAQSKESVTVQKDSVQKVVEAYTPRGMSVFTRARSSIGVGKAGDRLIGQILFVGGQRAWLAYQGILFGRLASSLTKASRSTSLSIRNHQMMQTPAFSSYSSRWRRRSPGRRRPWKVLLAKAKATIDLLSGARARPCS